MTALKLTKNELRNQQMRLSQFQRYLPTLQLKKAMLQFEVNLVQLEISRLQSHLSMSRKEVERFSPLLLEKVSCNVVESTDIMQVKKRYENVAGVEIPILEQVVFKEVPYFLFDTPVWVDRAIELTRGLIIDRETLVIADEKRRALEKDLRDVSIRVNLFEKILIPRAQENIKKIRVFLGDQQLASVAQAKVAKKKIEEKMESLR